MNKLCCLVVILTLVAVKADAQQAQAPAYNSNEPHDRMTALMIRTRDVVLSDSIINVLKVHAVKVNLHESIVLKSSFFLKMLYNDKLTKAEKIEACKYGLVLYDNPDHVLPLNFFTDMLKKLESK